MSNLDIKFKRLTPFKRCVLQNFPFIEADFDALTNYGLLCKIVEYLNNVIASQNEVQGVTEEIVTAFNNLYDYVQNYFDNLDVQEEINNKLDSMVEDGTLASIIQSLALIDDTINFHTHIAMTDYGSMGMQGGCMLPDGNIVQFDGTDKIHKISPDGSVILSQTHNIGHCNGVTYCDKNDKIYVTSSQSDVIGRYKIWEYDPLTLEITNTFDMADTFPAEPYGIAYISELEKFVFANWWSSQYGVEKHIWTTDINFENIEDRQYDFEVNTTSTLCRFGDYIGIDVLNSRKMLLFDVRTLDFVKQIDINTMVSDTWCITEPEWYDTRNGKIYIGFIANCSADPGWGGGTHIYGVYDPAKNYTEVAWTKKIIQPANEKYYVDHVNTPVIDRDGSQSKPFMNIYEALNSALRDSHTTGCVQIIINNDSVDRKYSPIFSMGKNYTVTYVPNHTIDFFYIVGVNQDTKVTFNRGLVLTPYPDELLNPYKYGDGGDLCIMGEFNCYSNVSKSDSSKVILCGDNSAKCRFGVANDGINVKDYWGTIEDINRTTKTTQSLVDNLHNTSSQTTFFTTITGIRQRIDADGNGKFFIPAYSKASIVTVKFNTTVNAVTVTNEITRVIPTGLWVEEAIYDDNGKHALVFNTTGEVTISGLTISRVIVQSC